QNKAPQWQKYRNLYGVDEMVKNYWKREKTAEDSTPGPFGTSKKLVECIDASNTVAEKEKNVVTENTVEAVGIKNNHGSKEMSPMNPTSVSVNGKRKINLPQPREEKSPVPKTVSNVHTDNDLINKMEWKSNLVKGKTKLFIGNVIVKPFLEYCFEFSSFNQVSSKNEALWMENFLPQSYAEEIIDSHLQTSIFIIESSTENPQWSLDLAFEKNLMEHNDIVGVIRINDKENSYWLIFPNTTRTCLKFGFSTQTQYLEYRPFFAVYKIISTVRSDFLNPTDCKIIEPVTKAIKDSKLFSANVFLDSAERGKLLEFCIDKPKFVDFSPEDNFERKEILNLLECNGAHETDYSEDVEIVLIHVLYEKQINFMPNLMRLKDLPKCKFILYGTDFRIKEQEYAEEVLQQGGFVTVTSLAFSTEKDVIERIRKVLKHQAQIFPGSKWEIVLSQHVKEYLKQISAQQNSYSLKSYYTILLSEQKDYIRYFKLDELHNFSAKSAIRNPPSMIKSLHLTMNKMHLNHWKEHRHYIVICGDAEKKLDLVHIEGVSRLSLSEFEMKFGNNYEGS
ncbi:12225_t:CDS:10, partial [Acaulospora morrowiae]